MATIVDRSGSNLLIGTNEDDLLIPLGGDDFVDGRGGGDTVYVTNRNSTLGGSSFIAIEQSSSISNAVEVWADGVDTLVNVEQVTAVGYNLSEVISIDVDISTEISANGGNDLIIYSNGNSNDTVNGGAGLDTLRLFPTSEALNLSLSSDGSRLRTIGAAAGVSDDSTDIIRNIERIEIKARSGNLDRNNFLTFSSFTGETSLEGGGGRDNIFGGRNKDTLDGGSGNDVLSGGLSDDLLRGGSGYDTALVRATDRATFSSNRITSSDGVDRFEGIEKVIISGSSAAQTFVPGAFGIALEINASGGDDIVFGTSKRDTLNGGSGDDNLFGLDDRDTIIGGAGNDFISGGVGSDRLSSGSTNDRDTFSYRSISEGGDLIRDFDTQGFLRDVIQVRARGFSPTASGITGLSRGELSSDRLVLGNASLGSTVGFRYIQSSGQLLFDGDGGGRSSGEELLATLRFGGGLFGSPVDFLGLANSISVV